MAIIIIREIRISNGKFWHFKWEKKNVTSNGKFWHFKWENEKNVIRNPKPFLPMRYSQKLPKVCMLRPKDNFHIPQKNKKSRNQH